MVPPGPNRCTKSKALSISPHTCSASVIREGFLASDPDVPIPSPHPLTVLLGRAYRSERSDCSRLWGALVGPRPATRLKFGAAWDRSTSMVFAWIALTANLRHLFA